MIEFSSVKELPGGCTVDELSDILVAKCDRNGLTEYWVISIQANKGSEENGINRWQLLF